MLAHCKCPEKLPFKAVIGLWFLSSFFFLLNLLFKGKAETDVTKTTDTAALEDSLQHRQQRPGSSII